jgi:hypothetical protein
MTAPSARLVLWSKFLVSTSVDKKVRTANSSKSSSLLMVMLDVYFSTYDYVLSHNLDVSGFVPPAPVVWQG